VTAGDGSNNKINNPTGALKGMQHQMMQTTTCEANAPWKEAQIDGT
jgi:hypothetical protein